MKASVKILTEPTKLLFYGYFYIASIVRRATGARITIQVTGSPHTRPYLTWKIFRLLGAQETRSNGADLSYFHGDATTHEPPPIKAINANCIDIRKSTIARAFEEAFGYNLDVDPRTHHGPMVEKSETNAAHDGRVIDGPISNPISGRVYQKVINNEVGEREVVDYRPCVIGHEIPFVYVKYRPLAARFSNDNTRVTAVGTRSVFSDDEVARMIDFCSRIGLEVGELDVLRDRTDGRIYIVDAAKTPHSPGDRFISLAGIRCMHEAAAAFKRQFLK